MEKNFDHKKIEEQMYLLWQESEAFKAGSTGEPYTILMPPPNANASLHAGHAMYTIDDIMIRMKRMQGFSTMWVPGRDHAGFETQFVYEKQLAKEGKSRLDYDRKTFYQNVSKFVEDNSGLIFGQFKKLGLSADWDRSVFTLDPQVLERVFLTFKQMESEGKVYRDSYIVNYCPHCGTSLSELEVEHEDRIDPLYYMKYGPFILATVRPETKFGDTAIAVHPDDKRYKKYVGQTIEVEGLIGKFEVKVVADEAVDPEFGTGAVKVTPAHDPVDFEIGKRHGLEVKQVIGLDGRLNDKTGKYAGLKVAEARKIIAEDLMKAGLLEKIDEKYSHSVGICYRCKRILEPTVVPNWFIRVSELKKPAIEVVNSDQVKFFPKKFKKVMLDWLGRMHDWPISRQIVWGIRIPVWYEIEENKENLWVGWLNSEGKFCQGSIVHEMRNSSLEEIERGLQWVRAMTGKDAPRYVVSEEKPQDGKDYLPETDTFDTWFSSGQWPLVTLRTDEFRTRFPTDFMGTLEDILPFWISRMIMFSMYVRKNVPFKQVYLWSMVTDAKGQKMSKSKGNVANPVEYIEKYGADALRMALIYGVAPGSRIPFSEEKIRGMRNFSNKIWNIARFLKLWLEESEFKPVSVYDATLKLEQEDHELIDDLNSLIVKCQAGYDKFRFADNADAIYEFIWHKLADVYIERIKPRRQNLSALSTCSYVFVTCLKLLHPIMPFVTEATWQELRKTNRMELEQLLIRAKWPKV
jgi:valyl-tRNA synthetase